MPTPRHLVLSIVLALTVLAVVAGPAAASPQTARLAAKKEQWSKAADAWQAVLERSPADREAAIGLATAVTKGTLIDLFVPAEDALQAVLQKNEKDRDARLALGELFIAQARSKTSQQAMKFIFEDAKSEFQKLLDVNAADEDAAVGLARTHYWTAYFSDALLVLDEFLAKGTSKGPALFWKGQVFYTQGMDAYGAAGAMTDEAKGLFREAMGAYEGATKASPKLFDGWMQLGYAAQYLGETDIAMNAYEAAMELDQESLMPLKGIEALYYHRQDEYLGALDALSHKHPLNRAVHFFMGFRQLYAKDFEAAAKSFQRFVKQSSTPQLAWTYLGQALDGLGQAEEARAAYIKSLRASPGDEVAAAALGKQILASLGEGDLSSPEKALEVAKAHAELLALAPRNPWIRNNVAFLLRDAIDRGHKNDATWRPVLDECIRLYDEAAQFTEEQVAGREESIPYVKRYQYAGVLNDTGLMLQYYPARVDLEKAEEHYLRALELTQDGFRDAWENLTKIYLDQGRWQEAYDLNRDCADAMTTETGAAHPHRAHAQSIADKLAAEGKIED